MEKRYIKDITRIGFNFCNVKIWFFGESLELKKVIGFGFNNTIFHSKNGTVTAYYDEEESKKFYDILDKVLNENFFNLLGFINYKNNDKIFNFLIKIWPSLVIFHEIFNYPEYANNDMLRRLFKLRKFTESFFYEFFKKIEEKNFEENYIFYKGKIFYQNFNDFIKEKNIIFVEK